MQTAYLDFDMSWEGGSWHQPPDTKSICIINGQYFSLFIDSLNFLKYHSNAVVGKSVIPSKSLPLF